MPTRPGRRSRNLGDYSTGPFEAETAEGVLGDAKEFVDAVEVYLEGASLGTGLGVGSGGLCSGVDCCLVG